MLRNSSRRDPENGGQVAHAQLPGTAEEAQDFEPGLARQEGVALRELAEPGQAPAQLVLELGELLRGTFGVDTPETAVDGVFSFMHLFFRIRLKTCQAELG